MSKAIDTATGDAAPSELTDETLDDISGGPNRRAHDHIGNFNVKADPNNPLETDPATGKVIHAESGGADI